MEKAVVSMSNHFCFINFFLVVKLWLLQEITEENTGNYKGKKIL